MKLLEKLDWAAIAEGLDADGFAATGPVLDAEACAALHDLYGAQKRFRKTVVMEHHGYGRGEYQYFAYPLPKLVADLRRAVYSPLAAIANRWQEVLGLEERFPETHAAFLKTCQAAGQERPTPLLLKYGAGDYNRLHQDLYGDIWFPLQLVILLDEPVRDFEGGEFILTEQRPRTQSKAHVVPLRQGEGVIFATSTRPERGARGWHRVNMRHGVSTLQSGHRMTLGVIFHDAK